MGFLTELLGEDLGSIAIIIGGLFITILAIILVVWLIKIAFRASRDGVRSKLRRLSVLHSAPVDNKRQLVIVRRDNVEHLIMIGGPNDVVIESGFQQEPDAESLTPERATASPAPAAVSPSEQSTVSPAPAIIAKPRASGPSRTTPISPLDDRREPSLSTRQDNTSNVTPMPNIGPIEKLQELARSTPDSGVSALKYPGILRASAKQKDVDRVNFDDKNQDGSSDSDKLSAEVSLMDEPKGAKAAPQHADDHVKAEGGNVKKD